MQSRSRSASGFHRDTGCSCLLRPTASPTTTVGKTRLVHLAQQSRLAAAVCIANTATTSTTIMSLCSFHW